MVRASVRQVVAVDHAEVIIAVSNVYPTQGATYNYTVDTIEALFADGFESNDTSAWSATVQ